MEKIKMDANYHHLQLNIIDDKQPTSYHRLCKDCPTSPRLIKLFQSLLMP